MNYYLPTKRALDLGDGDEPMNIDDVKAATGKSEAEIEEMVAAGEFPPPSFVDVETRRNWWRKSHVEASLKDRYWVKLAFGNMAVTPQ